MSITPQPPADFSPEIHDSHFTPPQTGYTRQGYFRFWCQTVLPLVYDDSLSYYELLNKIVDYLNNVISDVASVENNVLELYNSFNKLQDNTNNNIELLLGAYNELQSYVNSYFDNLDVQEEINNKLDALAENGTLTALMAPLAPAVITSWLNDHITPTTPPVDNSLTVSGAAADAKVTGDEIRDLKSDMHDVSIATYQVTASKGSSTNTSGDLVPFVAKNGDSITARTIDGTTFGDVQLRFYDESREYIKHWTLASAYGNTRTFTYDQTTEVYYVGITTVNTSSPNDYYIINNNNIYKQANNELQGQITTIQANIDILNEHSALKNIINRFNKSTISEGKYINPTNGTIANNPDCFASDFIYIGDLDSITVSYTHIFVWFDENKNHLTPNPDSMNSRSHDLTFTRPEGAVYLRFSTYNTDLNLAQIGESVSRSKYTPYGVYNLPELRVNSSQIEITDDSRIIVDVSGGGDYTSFTQAIYETVDGGLDVFVKPGIYNIVSEYITLFGQNAVNNMADSDSATFNGFQYGVRLRKRKIEFAPGAHLVCNWTGHTVDSTHRFSALGVDYDVEIIGLDLDVTAAFYCIHDDYGISTPYTVKYKNCRVVGHDIVNVNCIGGGCKKYSRHILNNCYFNNNAAGSTTVRYHNTNAEGAEPEIYVSNCYFNGFFTPRWYGTQTTKMRVYVDNCEARSIHKLAESSSFNVDNVELYKWCNTETNPVA